MNFFPPQKPGQGDLKKVTGNVLPGPGGERKAEERAMKNTAGASKKRIPWNPRDSLFWESVWH